MRTFTLFSLVLIAISSVSGHKYNGPIPKDKNGHPTTHQDPRINAKYTGAILNPLFTANLGKIVDTVLGKGHGKSKRRLTYDASNSEPNVSLEDLAALAKNFEGVAPVPANAKRASAPAAKLNGVVALYSQQYYGGSWQLKGYMQHDLVNDPPATISYTMDTSKVLYVTLPSATPTKYFDLKAINESAPYVGPIAGYSGSNWGKGSPGFGSITVVQKSIKPYPANDTNNPCYLPSESTSWSIDANQQLTGTWFNDNGKAVPSTIYIDVNFNDLGFTGDLNAFSRYYNQQVVTLKAYFVPLW